MFKKSLDFYDLLETYKTFAEARGFSPKTIRGTETNLKMIGKIIPLEMKLRKFSGKNYEDFLIRLRKTTYSTETIYDLNATLRKLIRLAEKKKLVRCGALETDTRIRRPEREDCLLVSFEDFKIIRNYFRERKDTELEFLVTLLYYSGVRIGEALALLESDFKDGKIFITKSFLFDFKLVKEPKNKKTRFIPEAEAVFRARRKFLTGRQKDQNRIFTVSPQKLNLSLAKIAKEKQIPRFHAHLFRHTFVSNLIREGVPLPVIAKVSGDTQKTILKHYSHMFERDEELVLKALGKIGKP